MVVSRGLAGFSRGREHLAVVSRAVVTVVRGQSFSDMVHVIFSRSAFFAEQKSAGDAGFWEGTRVSGRGHGFLAGDTGFWEGTKVSGRARKKMEVKFCRRRRQNFTDLMRPKAAFGPCLQANWIGIC